MVRFPLVTDTCHNGTSQLLRSLKVGKPVIVLKSSVSAYKNIHGLAKRQGIAIKLKSMNSLKVRITRVR